MKKLIPIIILCWFAYVIFTTSCANPGMPVGGDKDTIAPVVVETKPEFNERFYDDNTVSLTFDEFIVPEGLSEVLVVSPPIPKRPMIRTRSKTLIIDLGEDLQENTTYSIDFKDAIVDNNEKNPLEDFRFSFSTGEDFDSLMIGGYVKQAENLEPVEGALVVLHKLQSLSAFQDSLPNYIAKTDEDGFFIISNIAAGNYRLYALLDSDNSMTFNQVTEQIAFYDTLIVPHDWNVLEVIPDSINRLEEKIRQLPTPHFLMMYEEEYFDQYLDGYKREKVNMCRFVFSESLTDSFKLELLQPEPTENWSYLEFSSKRDSLQLWINDTTISMKDTLILKLDYIVKDTLDQFVSQTDTLEMFFKTQEKKVKKKKKDEVKKKINFVNLSTNLESSGFDVYRPLRIESPEPLMLFKVSGMHLYQEVDTLEEKLEFEIKQDSSSLRKYYVDYSWEYATNYRFEIDSASVKNYAGDPNNNFTKKFTTQKEGYYAKIILSMGNVKGSGIVQLLENSDVEKVLQKIRIEEDSEIEFPFLEPKKYKIKLIVDRNDNGKWDKGDIQNDIQPEEIIYFQKVLKLRSNFEARERWELPQDLKFEKDLVDEDEEKNNTRKSRSKKPNAR